MKNHQGNAPAHPSVLAKDFLAMISVTEIQHAHPPTWIQLFLRVTLTDITFKEAALLSCY
jgi:hypothetical protein